MYKPDYEITEGKLDQIVLELAAGEGDVKERLIEVFTEFSQLTAEDFPIELQDEWKSIMRFLTEKNAGPSSSAFQNSLLYKKKATCSKLVRRIINLLLDLREKTKAANQGVS